MPKIDVKPILHDQYDDIVAALDVTREGLAEICGVETNTIGWYRHKQRIPTEHLKAIQTALEKKLKGRRDLNPVEQRARGHLALALASGAAGPLSPRSAFTSTFSVDSSAANAGSATFTSPDLSKVPLEKLIEAIRRHGGIVTFGGSQRHVRKRTKKS